MNKTRSSLSRRVAHFSGWAILMAGAFGFAMSQSGSMSAAGESVTTAKLDATSGFSIPPAPVATIDRLGEASSTAATDALDTTVAKPADQDSRASALGIGNRYTIDSGDRIRVKFYQREDLSGDFLVGTEGTINLPLLGAFKVAGRDEDEIRSDIATTAKRVINRAIDVAVDVTERRPIYIVGYVEHPGVYPFALGMTVIHGLSMAGGGYRPQSMGSMDMAKDLTAIEQTSETLARDLVRLARLEAERKNEPFAELPSEVATLVGEAEAKDMVTRERLLQVGETELRDHQLESRKHSRLLAEQELESLQSRIGQIDNQIKLNHIKRTALAGLSSQGFAPRLQLADVDSNDSTLNLNRLDALASISRATRSLDELKSDVATAALTRTKELDADINTLTDQIDTLELRLKASQAFGGGRTKSDRAKEGIDLETLLFTIMRKSSKGYVYLVADDVTPLLPGDVLRVTRPRPVLGQVQAGVN